MTMNPLDVKKPAFYDMVAKYLCERAGLSWDKNTKDEYRANAKDVLNAIACHHAMTGLAPEHDRFIRQVGRTLCDHAGDSWGHDDGAQDQWCSTAHEGIQGFNDAVRQRVMQVDRGS